MIEFQSHLIFSINFRFNFFLYPLKWWQLFFECACWFYSYNSLNYLIQSFFFLVEAWFTVVLVVVIAIIISSGIKSSASWLQISPNQHKKETVAHSCLNPHIYRPLTSHRLRQEQKWRLTKSTVRHTIEDRKRFFRFRWGKAERLFITQTLAENVSSEIHPFYKQSTKRMRTTSDILLNKAAELLSIR